MGRHWQQRRGGTIENSTTAPPPELLTLGIQVDDGGILMQWTGISLAGATLEWELQEIAPGSGTPFEGSGDAMLLAYLFEFTPTSGTTYRARARLYPDTEWMNSNELLID